MQKDDFARIHVRKISVDSPHALYHLVAEIIAMIIESQLLAMLRFLHFAGGLMRAITLHKIKTARPANFDLEGNQAADTLFSTPTIPERCHSAMDTFFILTGAPFSTDGKCNAEIVADTCGRHDALGGACATESNTVRYALEKMHACLSRQLDAGGCRKS